MMHWRESMLKLSKLNLLTCLATLIFSSPTWSQIPAADLQNFKDTCQCHNCNLSDADLQNFKPGSSNSKENPFIGKTLGKFLPYSCALSCDLQYTNLSGANLSNNNFTTCIRGYITPLKNADFSYANLRNTKIINAIFKGAQFNYANLSNSNLFNSEFFIVGFYKANFSYANMTNVKSPIDAMHGWGSDMSFANFSNANLTGADINANFEGANFSYANLTNAKLSTTEDSGMWKYQTTSKLWRHVNFSYANLTGAQISPAELTGAILCHTVMPDGKINNRDCARVKIGI
jgi:uncharacterized protein YjbI with pentapeptide repeats